MERTVQQTAPQQAAGDGVEHFPQVLVPHQRVVHCAAQGTELGLPKREPHEKTAARQPVKQVPELDEVAPAGEEELEELDDEVVAEVAQEEPLQGFQAAVCQALVEEKQGELQRDPRLHYRVCDEQHYGSLPEALQNSEGWVRQQLELQLVQLPQSLHLVRLRFQLLDQRTTRRLGHRLLVCRLGRRLFWGVELGVERVALGHEAALGGVARVFSEGWGNEVDDSWLKDAEGECAADDHREEADNAEPEGQRDLLVVLVEIAAEPAHDGVGEAAGSELSAVPFDCDVHSCVRVPHPDLLLHSVQSVCH
eukprot:3112424-Rhodomonas_salina.3